MYSLDVKEAPVRQLPVLFNLVVVVTKSGASGDAKTVIGPPFGRLIVDLNHDNEDVISSPRVCFFCPQILLSQLVWASALSFVCMYTHVCFLV